MTKRKAKQARKVKKAKPKIVAPPNGAKLPPKNCVMEEEHEFELFV